MKILLFGEYSGFFNQLKNGLLKNDCDVTLAGRQDGVKNYNLDINLDSNFWRKNPFNYLRQIIYKLTNYDIVGLDIFYKFWKQKELFNDYDAVFLINPFPLQTHPLLEKFVLKHLFKRNKKVFLSACGDDYDYIKYLENGNLPYTLLDPLKENPKLKPYYLDSIKYKRKAHKKLHNYVIQNCKGIIGADIDYDMVYRNHPKYLCYIPFPVSIDKLIYNPLTINDEIIIFHGVNKLNYYKKGNHYFDEALKIVKEKYGIRVKILRTENLSYSTYINSYNSAHIVLDQVFGYAQGYNALEGMTKGKVVFSGAETEWLSYFNVIEDSILINAKPDTSYLVEKLSYLIDHPNLIKTISKNAREFVIKEHNDKNIANDYYNIFNNKTF